MSGLRYCCIDEGFTETESEFAQGSCPLQQVSVAGLIRDAVTQYTVVQTYTNPLKTAAVEAVYSFPLHEGVAVVGFEAEVDGRKIVGNVREKAAAKKEYDEAKKVGKVASLLEQESPDVFQACVGNIPPSKTVAIRLTLISDLKQDGEVNQVRFVVPTAIAPRYGFRVDAPEHANVDDSASKLLVDMSIAMSKAITSIQSPSHTIAVHLGSTSTDQSSHDPSRARVSLTTDAALDSDLVIIVQALGLDEPRALVERHPTDETHAIQVTFAPRFTLQTLLSSELIFIVDRSGSMSGTPIKQAGAALELFLRSIPYEEHYFNVIGFGSSHNALFPKSLPYNEESLKEAIRYAQTMQADMGGTEIAGALQEAFQRRRRDIPTQLFVLTDGEVWGVDTLCATIREAVDEGEQNNAFARVFSLGIGDSVSHNLIESMARAGGGYAQLVLEGERMEKKVLNMLKAALVPAVTNLGVQWTDAAWKSKESASTMEDFVLVEADGDPMPPVDANPRVDPKPLEDAKSPVDPKSQVDPSPSPINLFSTSSAESSPTSPTRRPLPDIIAPIQQAPFKIPILCCGARFTVYALLAPTVPVPTEVVLRGSSPDGPVELKVKTQLLYDSDDNMTTVLHSLAARALVRDLEEKSSCIHALGSSPTVSQQRTLERLGVHMVVEGKSHATGPPLRANIVTELAKKHIVDIARKHRLSSKYTSWVAVDEASEAEVVYAEVERPVLCYSAPPAHMFFKSAKMSAPTNCAPPFPDEESDDDMGFALADDDIGCSVATSVEVADAPPPPAFGGAGWPLLSRLPDESQAPTVADTDPHARLQSLLQHQSFDGSFPLTAQLAVFFSTTVDELKGRLEEVRKLSVLTLSVSEWETVWATCLAVEFMRTQLPELQDEWELVVEKAARRVEVLTRNQDVAAVKQAATQVGKQNAEDAPSVKEAPDTSKPLADDGQGITETGAVEGDNQRAEVVPKP